jgi:hypothetical protein
MNRTESAVGEAVGAVLGITLRLALDLLIFVVLPLLATGALLIFALHSWLTATIVEILDLSDSLVVRIGIGVVVFPLTIGALALVVGAVGVGGFVIVTASLHPAIKIIIALMSVGALLSTIAFVRDRFGVGADAPLELDFGSIWNH